MWMSLTRLPAVLLPVGREKLAEPADGFDQLFLARQEHDAEVVGFRPVEAGALHDEDLLLPQQIERELLVVLMLKRRMSSFGNRYNAPFGIVQVTPSIWFSNECASMRC